MTATAISHSSDTYAPTKGVGRRLLASPAGLVGSVLVAFVILAALLAPVISPYHYADTNFTYPFQVPFTEGFWLGTDDLGRDVLACCTAPEHRFSSAFSPLLSQLSWGRRSACSRDIGARRIWSSLALLT